MNGRLWTKEEEQFLIDNYQNFTREELGKRINRTKDAVQIRARMLGIKKRTHTLNHEFFDTWSDNMAWLVGFFAADGCVVQCGPNSFAFSFKQKEKEILQEILNLIGSSHPIGYVKSTNEYEIQFSSSEWYYRLKEIFECEIQRKSLTMSFPKIPTGYMRHFIRGCIDGDGCLSWQDEFYPVISFCSGSHKFSRNLEQSIFDLTGIKGHESKQSSVLSIRYGGLKAKCLSHWLYQNSSIHLKRKYSKYRQFLEWKPKFTQSRSITPKMVQIFPILVSEKSGIFWNTEKDDFIMENDDMLLKEKANYLGVTYNAVITRRKAIKQIRGI